MTERALIEDGVNVTIVATTGVQAVIREENIAAGLKADAIPIPGPKGEYGEAIVGTIDLGTFN